MCRHSPSPQLTGGTTCPSSEPVPPTFGAAVGVEGVLSFVDRGRRVDDASLDWYTCLGCYQFSPAYFLIVQTSMQSDVFPWAVAAAIAVGIALGVWVSGMWFG